MIAKSQDLEIAELRAEIERLKELNRQLQEQQAREQQAFAKKKAQRDELVQFLMDEYRKQHPVEEYEQWAREELARWEKGEGKWFTFEEMMADIQQAPENPPCQPEASSASSTPKA